MQRKIQQQVVTPNHNSTALLNSQSQLQSQTQNIQPLSQAKSIQSLSQVHSSNLLSQMQCSQPCTSLIAVFSYLFRSYFIAHCLILPTTVQCVEIVFVIFSCKTFRVKMERLLIFFCNTYETMVLSTYKIMSATNISEKNSMEKIPPDISDKRSLLLYLSRFMTIN